MKRFYVTYTMLDIIEAESLEDAEIIARENAGDKFGIEDLDYINDIEISEVK